MPKTRAPRSYLHCVEVGRLGSEPLVLMNKAFHENCGLRQSHDKSSGSLALSLAKCEFHPSDGNIP